MTKPKAKRAVRNGSEPNPKTALLNKAKEAIANGEKVAPRSGKLLARSGESARGITGSSRYVAA